MRDAEHHLEDGPPLLERGCELLLEELLAFPWCLPDLGELVPFEFVGPYRGGVGDPRAHEIRAGAHHPHDEPAAPVVAHEVDGPVTGDALQLSDDPVDVLLLRRPETRGAGGPEAGQLQGDHVGAGELGTERVPDRRCLGDPVHEDDGHPGSIA